jgi:hypothetical protein
MWTHDWRGWQCTHQMRILNNTQTGDPNKTTPAHARCHQASIRAGRLTSKIDYIWRPIQVYCTRVFTISFTQACNEASTKTKMHNKSTACDWGARHHSVEMDMKSIYLRFAFPKVIWPLPLWVTRAYSKFNRVEIGGRSARCSLFSPPPTSSWGSWQRNKDKKALMLEGTSQVLLQHCTHRPSLQNKTTQVFQHIFLYLFICTKHF